MNIAIVSQYFYPEEFKINDLVSELVKRGHNVTVITGKPNYPSGNFAPGYKFWGVKHEEYNGAKIIRVPLLRRRNGSGLNLALNYLSFVFFGWWYVKTHRIDADAIFCFETSPITQMIVALTLKKKIGKSASIWIQDLWPESVSAASNMKNPLVMKWLTRLVTNIYEKSDRLLVQSNGFRNSIIEKGNFSDKIVYAPNWAEDFYLDKQNLKCPECLENIPKGFMVMFAGNIGEAQDFDNVINAVLCTKQHENIHWVIVGDGRRRTDAEKKIKENGLDSRVYFVGRHKVTEMPHFFAQADCMLVSLKENPIFNVTIPSKVQTYMAAGKPIVTMTTGITNEIVNEADCGLTADAADFEKLAENVIKMSQMSIEDLNIMGHNSLDYYKNHFDKKKVIDTIVENLCYENR